MVDNFNKLTIKVLSDTVFDCLVFSVGPNTVANKLPKTFCVHPSLVFGKYNFPILEILL